MKDLRINLHAIYTNMTPLLIQYFKIVAKNDKVHLKFRTNELDVNLHGNEILVLYSFLYRTHNFSTFCTVFVHICINPCISHEVRFKYFLNDKNYLRISLPAIITLISHN